MKSCSFSSSRASALALAAILGLAGIAGAGTTTTTATGPAAGGAARSLSSVDAFERAVDSARQISSGGGDAVTRAELRGAIGFFQHDDGVIDSAERTALANFLAESEAQDVLSGAARKYAVEFLELNADLPPANLTVTDVQTSLVELFGAAGALTSSVWLQEAKVVGNGVLSQATLRGAYGSAFNASASTFDPINVRELINELSGRLELGTPTQDEVDGVIAFLAPINGSGNAAGVAGAKATSRLYLASWIGSSRGGEPGDVGGVVIAAVSGDRRTVRFLEVHGWTE
jgi:hypothetical protein